MECKCVSCGLDFGGEGDALREHYRSDLHRYNLKRRAVELPPVDAAIFQRKRDAAARALLAAEESAAQPKVMVCPISGKRFKTLAQFEQYKGSKKYKALAAEAERKAAAAAEAGAGAAGAAAAAAAGAAGDDETEKEAPPDFEKMNERTHCMFDNVEVDSLEEHVRRVRMLYGFVIPDEEYLTDLQGLFEYCMAKIIGGHECLYCNKRFSSPLSCQQHMRDSAHCRLPMDVEGGERMDEYSPFFDLDAKDAKSGWLKDGVEDLPSGELRLASGRILGNKALQRYYKQRHRPEAPRDATMRLALENSRAEVEGRMVRKWLGPDSDAEVPRAGRWGATAARAPTVFTKAQKATRADAARSMRVHEDLKFDTGMRHNKTQSRYFRIQNFQWAT